VAGRQSCEEESAGANHQQPDDSRAAIRYDVSPVRAPESAPPRPCEPPESILRHPASALRPRIAAMARI
jgi:hypothetical protein